LGGGGGGVFSGRGGGDAPFMWVADLLASGQWKAVGGEFRIRAGKDL
jgi:hypothetical protein